MPEQFPGTWYMLIDLGKQGLQKIKLQEVRTREAALIAAKILYRKAVQTYGTHEEDGITYPKPPRIVYAEDVDTHTTPTVDAYHLTVDYSLPLATAIVQCRFDGDVDMDITSDHFPPSRTGTEQVTFTLPHLNRLARTEEVLGYLEENNLRPATLEELLAFEKKQLDLQMKFPIVALGSLWRHPAGYCYVPCLNRESTHHKLGLGWYDPSGLWGERYRFAAVSKLAYR